MQQRRRQVMAATVEFEQVTSCGVQILAARGVVMIRDGRAHGRRGTRERESHPPAVVAGVDGSASSNEALRWALTEARLRKAPLRALHAWIYLHPLVPPLVGYPYTRESIEPAALDAAQQAAEAILDRALATVGDLHDIVITRLIVQDSPAQALIDAVFAQDLLVVGSRGRRLRRLAAWVRQPAVRPARAVPRGDRSRWPPNRNGHEGVTT